MADTTLKPVHTLVLDAGPFLKNSPSLSTLLARSHTLLTSPSVLKEIRDATARQRVDTLYLPFLVLRNPTPQSLRIVSDFARKTGDKSVLSGVDLEVLALAYELECERNGGDWRLRNVPGQKGLNGPPPAKNVTGNSTESNNTIDIEVVKQIETSLDTPFPEERDTRETPTNEPGEQLTGDVSELTTQLEAAEVEDADNHDAAALKHQSISEPIDQSERVNEPFAESESDSGSDGWITPSNIKKHQALDQSKPISTDDQKIMQVATITTDFAMQNVLLQMNLNLLSSTNLQRIRQLRTYILRCHGCFYTTKEMEKQFCSRCGKPTLTRVSCSTNANGEFKIHLKRNMQWNSRGDRYSIPKPVHGSSSGKVKSGGGKDGWGKDLILAEDQKEYIKALNVSGQQSRKERDLMDEDYLPGIVTGERRQGGGRVKVGAGRAVNSRKR